jgi:hypothetical protein
MSPQELRIGNIVEYLVYDELANPKSEWVENVVDLDDLKAMETSENYRPMKLNEDILLKFGYFDLNERCGLKGIFGIIGKKVTINIETMSYCQIDYEGSIFDIIKIDYVHQLQNLYFALTGEELTQIENL